ncbi:hypothetical protein RvY_12321 [Ramazzottius varieornatus]|uniref:Eukaryotic translation initiation factor 4E transporter n=1 Tax=Ramazzottius varieornatus TaxID=947166 RepID=A0A1D1VNB3_RAMVA|nr:hypothetical protein RvY_12321 [Ramazzottius varieornatus]
MAADTAAATEPLQDSIPSEKPASVGVILSRKTYTTEELHKISNLPRSKTCPSVLELDNAKSTPWLIKIIAGAEASPQARLEPFSFTNEERARGLRPTSESESGMSLLPQRSSFQTGCRPVLHLSPSKGKMGLLGMKPESAGTFETLDRNRASGENPPPILRNGTREFFNTRLQNYGNNNNLRINTSGYNSQNGYSNYSGDRYNSNGQRTYNNNSNSINGGGFRRFDRNMEDGNTFERNNGRGERNYDDPRGGAFDDEPLPEWAEDGPSSQNDYIELRGFDDDPADDASSKDSESVDKKSDSSTKDSSSVQSEAAEKPDVPTAEKKDSLTGLDRPDIVIPLTAAAEASKPPETDKNTVPGKRSRFAEIFSCDGAPQPAQAPREAAKVASASPPTPSTDVHQPAEKSSVPPALASILATKPTQVSPAEQHAGRTLLSFIRKDDAATSVSQAGQPTGGKKPVARQMRTLEDIEKEHQRPAPAAETIPPDVPQQQVKLPATNYPTNVSTAASAGGQSRFFEAFGSEASHAAQATPSTQSTALNGPTPLHRGVSFHGSLPHLGGVLDPSAVVRAADSQVRNRVMDPRSVDPRTLDPSIVGAAASSVPSAVPVPIPGIPNDPHLHELLKKSEAELVQWKEAGYFEHSVLLELLQLKQQRANFLAARMAPHSGQASPLHFGNTLPGQAAQISGAPSSAGLMRSHNFVQAGLQGLQQQQMQMAQHNRLPNMAPVYGSRYPGDVPSHAQNGLFGQGVDPRQLQQLRSNQQINEGLALLRMANAQQQLSDPNVLLARQQEQMRMAVLQQQQQQRQLAQASQASANVSRPSPLMPTSVLRRQTVQRGEFNQTPASVQSSMHHSASSPQFGLDQRHSLMASDDQQRLFLAAQQQQQQQAAFAARSNQANPADHYNLSNFARYGFPAYPQNAQAES